MEGDATGMFLMLLEKAVYKPIQLQHRSGSSTLGSYHSQILTLPCESRAHRAESDMLSQSSILFRVPVFCALSVLQKPTTEGGRCLQDPVNKSLGLCDMVTLT